jgi:hypothetical protein
MLSEILIHRPGMTKTSLAKKSNRRAKIPEKGGFYEARIIPPGGRNGASEWAFR